MIYCIIAIISIICSCSLTYIILRPKLRQIQKYDFEVEQLNYKLLEEKEQLQKDCDLLTWDKEHIQADILLLKSQQDNVQNSIDLLKNQAQQSADVFYEQAMKIAEQRFDADLALEEKTFDDAQSRAQNEYLSTLEECVDSFQKQIVNKQAELVKIDAELADHKSKLNAAIEQAKRQAEMEQKQDFYRLQLSQLDIEEIEKIRSIIPYLRDAEPVNKVIWKVYYEKPYSDLVGRVIGTGIHTGIYKITNLQNKMCYVGQSVDLASRWKQHIRRGVGADSPTRNKLYPAMQELGPENFTFEVLEECTKAQLDEREDYWQEYYGAREYGYSIK